MHKQKSKIQKLGCQNKQPKIFAKFVSKYKKLPLLCIITYWCLITPVFAIAPNASISSCNSNGDETTTTEYNNVCTDIGDLGQCKCVGMGCNLAVTGNAEVKPAGLNNAYTISIQFSTITHTITDDGNTTTTSQTITGYTFPENYKVKVIDCDEYPELENIVLDLEYKTLNADGIVTIQIQLVN